MTAFSEYHEYLRQRSRLGLIYRRSRLYPKLEENITGDVLDVGCGIGDFLRYHPGSVGVDINSSTVKWCHDQGLDVRQMETNQLPFEEDSFDTVIMDNVLEHIAEPKSLLAEVKRVLRPYGAFVVGVPGMKGYFSDPDHKVFYTREALLNTLNSHGFKTIKMFGMPLDFEILGKLMRQYCVYGIFSNDISD